MRRALNILIPCAVLGLFCGCATEYNLATGKEETLMYGTEKEISIGDAVARQMNDNFEICMDVDVNERAKRVLDRLVPVCDRKDLVYIIRVIDDEKINAVSLPGGYIYLFKGLMDRVKEDDQLAGVIAHELGHITAKHAIKRLQNAYGYMVLQALAVSTGDADAAQGAAVIYTTLFFANSQRDEMQADRLAVKYARKAGYDPEAMIKVLKLLKEEERKGPLRSISYFRTHPYINERIAALNQEISGTLEFEDYLNLTGTDY